MAIEKIDFHSIFLNEGDVLYSDLSKLDPDEFNNWVSATFNEIATITSLTQICPEKLTIEKLKAVGYFHLENQCHYSAKAACLLSENIDYYTGFVLRKDSIHRIITHSFNTCNSYIVDFSRVDTNFEIFTWLGSTLPHTYFGVNIPRSFLENFRNQTLIYHLMNPLLFEWFLECTKPEIQ